MATIANVLGSLGVWWAPILFISFIVLVTLLKPGEKAMRSLLEEARGLGLRYYPDPSKLYFEKRGFPVSADLTAKLNLVLSKFLPWCVHGTESFHHFGVIQGRYRKMECTLFQSRLRSGNTRGSPARLLCLVEIADAQLPFIFLVPKSLDSTSPATDRLRSLLLNNAGISAIDWPEDPEIDRDFFIGGHSEDSVKRLLTRSMIESFQLIDCRCSLQAYERHVLISFLGEISIKPGEFRPLLDTSIRISSALSRNG